MLDIVGTEGVRERMGGFHPILLQVGQTEARAQYAESGKVRADRGRLIKGFTEAEDAVGLKLFPRGVGESLLCPCHETDLIRAVLFLRQEASACGSGILRKKRALL